MKAVLIGYENKEKFLKCLRILKKNKDCQFEAYTSCDVEEVDTLVGAKKVIPWFFYASFVAGMLGLISGFAMQYFAAVRDVPLNVGGRPLNSWPTFIPVSFVLMILFTGLAVYFCFFYQLKLPKPSAPIFFAKSFDLSKNLYRVLIRSHKMIDVAELEPDQIEEYGGES